MNSSEFRTFPCDLCGADNAEEIAVARAYTDGQPIHVCRECGFVYVRQRRSAKQIAEVWSKEIFQKGYTAKIPAVRARQSYVAEFINNTALLSGRSVCDIGGGEGQFLDIIRNNPYYACVFAVEPSEYNCGILSGLGISHFRGTVEEYLATNGSRRFDVATIMWTLENCESCTRMLDSAYELLVPGGILCVATGSRLLVPFKKPLHMYFSKNPADSHAFRFSANTLQGLMARSGFATEQINRYIDSDYLTILGRKVDRKTDLPWKGDDWREIVGFFERWDNETRQFFPAERQ